MDITILLKSIGKETFVNFFEIFRNKSIDECKDILKNEGYSYNSINTKVYNSKKIFTDNREFEALRIIDESSNRISKEVKEKARRLLKLYKA